MLIDSHAHLNLPQLSSQIDDVLKRAKKAGVVKIVCVGTSLAESRAVIKIAQQYEECYATVGLHPHDAKHDLGKINDIRALIDVPEVVAIGECGLDYYHHDTSKHDQEKLFRQQIELALEFSKPVVFHVRDAFKDFFRVVSSYPKFPAVVHSFTGGPAELEQIMVNDHYVALNGIVTLTKEAAQLEAAKTVPLDKLMLETDAPFLTPSSKRGKVNEPSFIKNIAEFLTNLRGEDINQLSEMTSINSTKLFKL